HRPKAGGEIGQWLELASNVDYSARAIIRFFIAYAAIVAAKKESKWLESGLPSFLEDTDDVLATKLLIRDVTVKINLGEEISNQQVDELADIRDRLDGLVDLSCQMRDMINDVFGKSSGQLGEGVNDER
ncbi:MAG TPA: hypothetical protein VN642_11715, partial [Dongiaceae bacterium]|nr:hypothetical protein [Dongiaceae bacterium]